MTLSQDTERLGEVDKWRALLGVDTAKTNDSDLGQPARVRFEHSIDERGRSDADRGDFRRRDRCDLENFPDGVLDTLRDLGRRGRLVVSKDTTARLMQTSHVDEYTIGVRAW